MTHLDTITAPFGAQELRYLDLGDKRLKARGACMLEQLVAHADTSLPDAMGNPAATKAAYRFLENEAVEAPVIRQAHHARTRDRIRPLPRVLFIQDTTSCDFTDHPGTTGLGPLECAHHQGFFLHSTLAVTPEGAPLGLVDQQVWARHPDTVGQAATRRQRPTAEKESQRWLDALTASHQDLSPAIETITIADREADLYALFAQERPPQAHLLVRASQVSRCVYTADEELSYLWAALADVAPVPQRLYVEVTRAPGREPRTAVLTLRYTPLTLRPPHGEPGRTCAVSAILVEEQYTPTEATPIRWLLLTTWPITTEADAIQCVTWYALRWLIERFHYILKSGCTLEKLQLESVDALYRAQALYAIVAWRVLQLTYLSRLEPDAPCTVVFAHDAWPVLAAAACPDTPVPSTPPSLRQAVAWLARLGGHLGRKGDSSPGPKTIWRGLRQLDALMEGVRIAQRLGLSPGKAHFVGNA